MGLRAAALALLAPLVAFVASPTASGQDLTITVRLRNDKLDVTKTFVRRGDDKHRCVMPDRIKLPTPQKPISSPEDPPDYVAGYQVVFGPDPATLEEGGSPVPMGSAPGLPPANNPTVNYFSLVIDPLPNQLRTSGAVKLSRSFALGMTARGAWKGRFAGDDPKTSGSVTLDSDGLSGRFRLAHVEPDLAHGRMAESEYVTVTGSWRCPPRLDIRR